MLTAMRMGNMRPAMPDFIAPEECSAAMTTSTKVMTYNFAE